MSSNTCPTERPCRRPAAAPSPIEGIGQTRDVSTGLQYLKACCSTVTVSGTPRASTWRGRSVGVLAPTSEQRLVDLARRMIRVVEAQHDVPAAGLDVQPGELGSEPEVPGLRG